MVDIKVTTRRPAINIGINNQSSDTGVNITGLSSPPMINGVALIGNRTMEDILKEGIIIDGYDASWVAEGD